MAIDWQWINRTLWKILRVTFVWGLILYISVEFVLFRWVDPAGGHRYHVQMRGIKASFEPHEVLGYTHTPTQFNFGGGLTGEPWRLTFEEDGRVVPATSPSGCDVGMVGDSVTMGHGVDDSETVTNLLALQFPDVEFHNWGLNGYNTWQVASTIDERAADVYVYIVIGNDAEEIMQLSDPEPPIVYQALKGTRIYLYTWQKQRAHNKIRPPIDRTPNWFLNSMDTLINREDVLVFGFEGVRLTDYILRHNDRLIVIPEYTEVISQADPHPNPTSHEFIMVNIAPYVDRAIERFCD